MTSVDAQALTHEGDLSTSFLDSDLSGSDLSPECPSTFHPGATQSSAPDRPNSGSRTDESLRPFDRLAGVVQLCREAFQTPVDERYASHTGFERYRTHIATVCKALEALGMADLPVPSAEWAAVSGQKAGPVVYVPVYECADFEMGMFLLPAGCAMPLHDHPGMTVIGKIMTGSLLTSSFEWLTSPVQERAAANPALVTNLVGEAYRVYSRNIDAATPCNIVTPTYGNVHSYTAHTPSILFDIQSPPYSPTTGRDCHYYSIYSRGNTPEGSPTSASPPEPSIAVPANAITISAEELQERMLHAIRAYRKSSVRPRSKPASPSPTGPYHSGKVKKTQNSSDQMNISLTQPHISSSTSSSLETRLPLNPAPQMQLNPFDNRPVSPTYLPAYIIQQQIILSLQQQQLLKIRFAIQKTEERNDAVAKARELLITNGEMQPEEPLRTCFLYQIPKPAFFDCYRVGDPFFREADILQSLPRI